MTEKRTEKGKVSVIIPAYNNEPYIAECVNSVLNQTYENYEIIIVDDASEDDTLYIAKELALQNDCIRIINNDENKGQGYSRNYALNIATGEYVIFLDSDDFLEPVTLEVVVKKIMKDKSDFVVFDWKYYKTANKTYSYVNKDEYFSKKFLIRDECLDLLSAKCYFSVNRLYSKKFLKDNDIKFGEGHLYEDWEFLVKSCMKAKKVSLVPSPLYTVRLSSTSSTKINHDTNIHSESYIKAVRKIMKMIGGESKEQYYYLYKYLIRKFWSYYDKRVGEEYKEKFIRDFVHVMRPAKLKNTNVSNKLVRLSFGFKFFERGDVAGFKLLYIAYKAKKEYDKSINKIKKNIRRKFKRPVVDLNLEYWKKSKGVRKKDIILFMGFDYRYTGNSRYLFEQILRKRQKDVYFVTEDERVDKRNRIKPGSEEFYNLFYAARIVVFESWIPTHLRKTPCAVWVQLWHGTPLKKMLFDSNEEEIITRKSNHKILKFNDIRRWNYLITDNEGISEYFEKAFLIPKKRILPLGYPRVEYLIENKNDVELKNKIKKKAGLPLNKKIATYLPTWRDYNYGEDEQNFNTDYLLDDTILKNHLGDEYEIVSKNHTYLDKAGAIKNVDLETQELLLISDYLISDYSSVIFDAFAIDLPVVLLVKDYDKYMKSRGVYEELWEVLKGMACKTEKEAANKIVNYEIDDNYKYIKENICYKNTRNFKVSDFVLKLAERKGKFIRKVLTYGTFDLFHQGHVRILKRAKALGDKLIVAISTDEFNAIKGKKSYHSYETRKEILESVKYVDMVIPEKEWGQKRDDVKKYNVDIVVMGDDWTGNEKFECLRDLCDVVYLPRTENISTSKIKKDLGLGKTK